MILLAVCSTPNWCQGQNPSPSSRVEKKGPSVPGNIVAVVNAETITRQQLADQTMRRYGKDIVDRMVSRFLIMQACQAKGIGVTDAEIMEEIKTTASRVPMDVKTFLKMLEEERGVTYQQYASEIVWQKLALEKLVADQIQVSDEEINAAFDSQFGPSVKCRMIIAADQQRANQLHAAVTARPEMFGAYAKKYSEDKTTGSMNGLIPPIHRNGGDPAIAAAVFALQPNGITPVMKIGNEYAIFQAVKAVPGMQPGDESIDAILAQIKEKMIFEKTRVAAATFFESMQKHATIVNVLEDPKLQQQHPGVAAIINGQQISIQQAAAQCIERHGREVLTGEINRKLLAQALKAVGKGVTQRDLQGEIERAAIGYGYIQPD
ncbi:MAG: peptidylprolyl isomerase, partial [Planctomycetota bacterium]